MKNRILILVSFAALVILPGIVFGQDGGVTLGSMASAAASTALSVATGVVVVMWVVAGILFLLAAGDPGKLGTAKTGLIAAVIGTVVVIVANGAVALVGGAFRI